MRDARGEEWLPVAEAALRVRVRPSAIYVWVQRRKVRAHRIGGRAYVAMPDVQDAELAWRQRVDRADKPKHLSACRVDTKVPADRSLPVAEVTLLQGQVEHTLPGRSHARSSEAPGT